MQARKYLGILMLFGILSLSLQSSVIGQVYQWEDEEGVVQMTDNPKHIPEKYRDLAKEVTLPNGKETPARIPNAEGEELFAPTEKVDNQGHRREWWQSRVKEWRQKKATAEQQLADANGRLAQMRMALPSIARRQAEMELQEEIRGHQEEIQQAERVLSDQLPEEARKANAFPGWLRESPE